VLSRDRALIVPAVAVKLIVVILRVANRGTTQCACFRGLCLRSAASRPELAVVDGAKKA
jgi:hypothetical protein